MHELLAFLETAHTKYRKRVNHNTKSLSLVISIQDLQILIESVTRMREAKVFQDEIDRLKQQHAEGLEIKDNLIKMQSETIEYLEKEIAEFKSYRQAIKDIFRGG